jgi:hypothetical protein
MKLPLRLQKGSAAGMLVGVFLNCNSFLEKKDSPAFCCRKNTTPSGSSDELPRENEVQRRVCKASR